MIEYIDECVGCPPEMGCLGNSCSYKNQPYLVCDECGTVMDDSAGEYLYEYDVDQQLCLDCLSKHFTKIELWR